MNFEYGTESWRRIPYSSNAGLFCIVETKQVQEKTSRLRAVSSTIGMLKIVRWKIVYLGYYLCLFVMLSFFVIR